MLKRFFLTGTFFTVFLSFSYSQDSLRVQELDYVIVDIFHPKKQTNKTIFPALLPTAQITNTLNIIPGVRMEERSPGSYRINLRGSSQRAPFGIRNVKFYLNGIPFTEPGGNTYLNQLNMRFVSDINVFKGPVLSEYGAGTGGVVSLQTIKNAPDYLQAEGGIGSFGEWNSTLSANLSSQGQHHYIAVSKEQSKGYRHHSSMERSNFIWVPRFDLGQHQLSALALYSDLWYQTPGGLTLTQYETDRKASRPVAGIFPGAADAQAAIDQKNILLGITHRYLINTSWSLTSSVYTSKLSLENPTFRNYEIRQEPHSGTRIALVGNVKSIKINTGLEYQAGNYHIQTFTNQSGRPGILETNDQVNNKTGFIYANLRVPVSTRVELEGGYSANFYETAITRLSNPGTASSKTDLPIEHLPKFRLKYNNNEKSLEVNLIASKGYSPPSSSEVLPSNTVINTLLRPEIGWNYELQSLYSINSNIFTELSLYYKESMNTIVQRRDEDNADYFMNAGKTAQIGIEGAISYNQPLGNENELEVKTTFNYADFTFKDYKVVNDDFSDKKMPGNMRWTVHASGTFKMPRWAEVTLSFGYYDRMYLNDANTFASAPYRIMNLQVYRKLDLDNRQKHQIQVRAGINNLLNDFYSLGFDFNAAGNRFYNAAPGINYFGSIAYRLSL
jgi:iron complex outermembrane receptor protein